MTALTETDIKELKDLINTRFEQLDNKINDFKISQVRFEEKVNALDEKLDRIEANLNKRLDDTNAQLSQLQGRVNGQTNWFIGIFTVLVAGLLGILGKVALFPNL